MDPPKQCAEVCIFPRPCDSADLELQLMMIFFLQVISFRYVLASSLPGFMLTVDLFPFHRKKATLLPSYQYSSSTLMILYSFPVQVFLYSTNRVKLMTKNYV